MAADIDAVSGGGEAFTLNEVAPLHAAQLNLRAILVGIDLSAVLLGWVAGLVVGLLRGGAAHQVLPMAAVAALATIGLLRAQRLYLARNCVVKAEETAKLGRAAFGPLVFVIVGVVIGGSTFPLLWMLAGGLTAFILLAAGRSTYRTWLSSRRRKGQFGRPVIIVGANDEAAEMAMLLEEHPELGFEVCAILGDEADATMNGLRDRWRGRVGQATQAAVEVGATGAVVISSALPPRQLNDLVRSLLAAGLHVHLSSGLRGISHHRVSTVPLAHEPLLYVEAASLSGWQLATKRVLDLLIASLTLVVVSPVMLVTALAIKFHDGGPVLFVQDRVGREGKLFRFYKFRTMVPDAEARLGEVIALNQRDGGPLFKLAEDPRVTGPGRFLRATSIDELPQLFNVIRGSMSLVGPRPALPWEAEQFDGQLSARSDVLPGITGLWQVEARDKPSFGAYRRLDLFYVENWSVPLDLSILLRTAAVVCARGIRAVLNRQVERSDGVPVVLD